MKDKNEILLEIAFFLLVIGWSLDMFVVWVPSWISWGTMILSVGLAVAYKMLKNRNEIKESESDDDL